ncbi:MAG: hypothetical protein HIU86_01695 [Acidobacteria bacterium]|nr:hypothetical protein [Acidobacteriota bacterium]
MTEEGEALRRRLYRPGADDEDVAAYRSVAERDPEGHVDPDPAPPRTLPRLPARPVLVATGVLAVLVVVSALLLQAAQAPPAAAGPTPLPTRAVPALTAARFAAAVARGDDAGLGAWWDPAAPFLEEHGSGDGTVLLPASASDGSGRLTVLLVLAADGTAGWSAARLVIHDDRTIHLRTESSAFGSLRAGVPAIGRSDFAAGHRPMRLFVQAPGGIRWGVAAIITG